jgi:CheY-like chemotaxis protein
VDDYQGNRETFGAALRRAGFDVRTAASGKEALAAVLSHSFDLVVVDLQLGDMLGTELVRRWHAAHLNLPFIMISAFLTTEHTVDAMRLGALGVADGWMDIDRLVAMVLSALEKTSATTPTDEDEDADAISPDVRSGRSSSSPLAHRCALWILNGARAPNPFKTEASLARINGIVRDLARILWALRQTGWKRAGLEEQLDVGDDRTERELLDRAGIRLEPSARRLSVQNVLDVQRFIGQESHVLRSLRSLLATETDLE